MHFLAIRENYKHKLTIVRKTESASYIYTSLP